MKCPYCSCETLEEGARFCPQCGNAVPQPEMQVQQPNTGVFGILQDGMFLALCVLLTAACLFAAASKNFSVLTILYTIFLWIAYAKSRKGIVAAEQLRCVSGTVFAEYVIGWIGVGALVLLGIVFFVLPEHEVFELLKDYNNWTLPGTLVLQDVLHWMGVVMLIAAAVAFIVNYFAIGRMHRLAKSVYQNAQDATVPLKGARTVRNWLWVLGILSILGGMDVIGSAAFFADACSGAAAIVSALLIQKHLL